MQEVQFPGKASDFLKIGVAAAARGDVEMVRAILKARPKWINHVGSHARTMLWEASHRGKLEMVKYLIRRKADINACGTHYTPYFVEVSCYCIARHKKHDDVANLLLTKGARVDIHTAAFLGDCDGVRAFLEREPSLLNDGHPQYEMGNKHADGLDFYLAPAAWATPLCYALRGGNVETVRYLIEQGAAIQGNEEALFIAVGKDVNKLRLLLEHGADPQFAPEVYSDEGELFELLTAHGVAACSNTLNEELVYLCRGDRGGNPDAVSRLLKLGGNVDFQDHKGKTALHRAAKAGFVATMQILLDHGASSEIHDLAGETPLFDAMRSTIKNKDAKQQAIRLLLDAGADAHAANRRQETPSSIADAGRCPDATMVRRLLREVG